MNCKNFENVIGDLARNQMIDAQARESALEHADGCAQCGARLADEQTLTLGLRALSMQSANVEAPAKVEAALFAAFRAPEKVVALGSYRKQSATRARSLWKVAAAVAAAVVLTFFTFALKDSHWPKPSPGERAAAAKPATNDNATPVQVDEHEKVAVKDVSGVGSGNQAGTGKGLMQPENFRRNPARRANRVDVANKSNGSVRPAETANNAGNAEVATDFMPLTYDAGVAPLDSGHLVRVELPRTALLSMGLPMSVERQNEYVKADVLMGEDGVARAIRFVR